MKRKARPHEHQGELNIVPYLDIMVNLVMFMLLNMTGFITFSIINMTAPEAGPSQAQFDPANPPPKDDKKPFQLTVVIGGRGFFLIAENGTLPGQDADAPAKTVADVDTKTAEPTVPLLPDGTYDFKKLHELIVAVKDQHPESSQLFIAADRSVKYETIVDTMDATRGDRKRMLFPDVAFAAVLN